MHKTRKFKVNLGTFDLIKGIAIICIVFGHMLSYFDIEELAPLYPILAFPFLMRSAANPMFLMISGFGFKPKKVGICLKKGFSELIIPYVFVTLIVIIVFPIIHFLTFHWWPGAIHETIRYALAFLFGVPKSGKEIFGYELYECSVVWFLLASFLAINLLNVILKVKSFSMQNILVILCVLAGYALFHIDFDYYCIPQGLMSVGYCYTGYIIKKRDVINNRNPLLLIVLAGATAFETLFGGFGIAYGVFKIGFVDYLLAGCSGAFFMISCILTSQIEWKILEPIKQAGMYTYWIMCIHSIEMTCIPWYISMPTLIEHQVFEFILEIVVKAVIIFLGCVLLKKLTRYFYKRRILLNGK